MHLPDSTPEYLRKRRKTKKEISRWRRSATTSTTFPQRRLTTPWQARAS